MTTRLSSLTLHMVEDVLAHDKGDADGIVSTLRHIVRNGCPPDGYRFHDGWLHEQFDRVQKAYAHLQENQ